MTRVLKSKKGVSPLIATVLIIALTVALTVFLMNWAFGFFKERTSETSKSTKEQLLCVSAVDFDLECSCQKITGGTCSFTVINNNALQLGIPGGPTVPGGVLNVRLISTNQKIVTTTIAGTATTPPIDSFGTAPSGLSITKPAGATEPFDLEIIIPKVKDPTTGVITECGGLAKLRKMCDMNLQ